jgi:thiamine pyrophosphate-dependent acetolactate synthase large subunit-like protein
MDFTAMARSAGYARAYQFDDLEELVLGLEEAMAQPGPVFVLLKVGPTEGAAMPGRSMAEGWADVRRTLAARE